MPTLHRRDAIASLLWPEQPRENARHSLRQALTTLRRLINDASATPPYLLTEGESIAFNPDSDARIDIVDFNRLLDECAAHGHRQLETCVPCSQRHERVIELYRGEFCAGASLGESEELDAWLQVQRERFHRRATGAFSALVEFHERNGRHGIARQVVERQLEIDPWRESAHRALMRLLVAMNERSAALRHYEKCRQMLEDELGVEPEPETIDLYERIRDGDEDVILPAPRASEARRAIVQQPLTPLIGREQETAQIADLLTRADCRLLTLVGPGGIGKTRLAVHAAEQLSESFADGSVVVPLAPVRSVDLLAPTIAATLGVADQGRGDPMQYVLNILSDRELLLVLDSMEHLLDASPLLGQVLARAPGLRILATSRVRLGLRAEWVFPIGGLSLPQVNDGSTDLEAGSVQLFLDGLRRVRPHLPVSDEERAAIGTICQLVDGMPLAIELASAWASTLSIDAIAQEIEHSIDFLEMPLRDLPERHRSIRAVFDQSWERLSDEEQQVFRRLSLFRDSVSREAAERVAGASLPILSSLVGSSFLRAEPGGRYTVHDLLRQYGERQLAIHPRDELRTRDRFSRYFLTFVAEREQPLTGQQQNEALADLTTEIANIRQAWRIALQLGLKDAINRAMHGLWLFYVMRGWMREGESAFGEVVEAFDQRADDDEPGAPSAVLARALTRQGGFASGLGHYETGAALIRQGLDMLRALGDHREVALALNFLAAAMHLMGHKDEEREMLEESLRLFREVDDPWGEAYVLDDLAMLTFAQGDTEHASALCRQSQALLRRIGDARGLAFTAENLGMIALAQGDLRSARALHEEALALRQASDDQWGIASSLVHLGVVLRAAGNHEDAEQRLMTALRIGREAWVRPVVLEGLVELAILLAEKGEAQRAGELFAVIIHDSAASRHLRERAESLLSELEERLPEVQRVILHERAAATNVDLLARMLLS